MPLKKEFITYISHEKGTHIMQGQRGKTSFGQAAVDGARGTQRPEPLLGFPRERQDRAEYIVV